MAKVKQPKVDSVAAVPPVSRSLARNPATARPATKGAAKRSSVPLRLQPQREKKAQRRTKLERAPVIGRVSTEGPKDGGSGSTRPTTSSGIRPERPTSTNASRNSASRARAAAPRAAARRGKKVPAVVSTRAGAGAPSRKAKVLKARGLQSRSPKGAARNGSGKGRKHLAQKEPVRVVQIKQLDPFARCGPRTSVVHLYRVEERLDGESSVHLVFFDRHGWYCEHGKTCRAVDDLRRNGKQLGLTF